MPLKLESKIVEYGENLSVGERQLICLARVLLRRSKIIVMDEATSSVDYETDKLIQATIHKYMRGTTLLVIAHRIHSVIDADKIVLMADGEVAECDTPARLLDNPTGQFTLLVKSNGERAFVHLSKIARGEMDFFAGYDTNNIEASISPSPSADDRW
ncbi:hypothetical protein CBR_g3091 [Chara braunii]|uniref:ABC transporter domain-containing protein n=1 Tax=Chara braunii TaxID=69332 RepID=A0A388KEW6_CHABU|nr:hypothetical protein CBR_g3091 [Chara braunii]|eukprot:GBG68547.1 hypothetical protein CBR_g3091 [Chara braunii]